jgi:hypothetical protein
LKTGCLLEKANPEQSGTRKADGLTESARLPKGDDMKIDPNAPPTNETNEPNASAPNEIKDAEKQPMRIRLRTAVKAGAQHKE